MARDRSIGRRLTRGDPDDRVRATWRIAVPVALFLVATAVGAVPWLFVDGLSATAELALSALSIAALTGGILSLSATRLDRRPLQNYGFHLDRGWCVDFVGGLALGVGINALVFLVGHRRGWLVVDDLIASGADPFLAGLVLVGVGLLAMATAEQVLFRGIVLTNALEGLASRGLDRGRALVGAILVSAVVFGVAHVGSGAVPSGLPLAAMVGVWSLGGLLYAVAYALTGELALPIGLHFASNLGSGVLFLGLDEGDQSAYPAVLQVEVLAPELWHPVYGLPNVAATVVGLLGVVGWVYLTRDGLSRTDAIGRVDELASRRSR